MAKDENPKSYAAMSVSDVAELLGLTDRQVRNLINDKGLPATNDGRGFVLDWPTTLEWYAGYRSTQKCGNGGNRRPETGQNDEDEQPETFNEAILRKTRAEADLKELQLARERGEVAAIADVERVLTGANKAIQTRILALPASLSTQLLGIDDRNRIFTILDRSMRELLTNLARINAIQEARAIEPESEDE
jgi:excisionase family DNA binding protein